MASVRDYKILFSNEVYVTRSKRHFRSYRQTARLFIEPRVVYYSTMYGTSPKRIMIKNHKTRWGSCSELGNLNFNYKLIFLPDAIVDYIVVHEICHLIEFNHSQDFWRLVARTIPNFRELRHELRSRYLL